MKKANEQTLGNKVLAGGMAALFAASCFLAPMSAWAADGKANTDNKNTPSDFNTSTGKPVKALKSSGFVNGAATRAAMPSIEILGMASVEESGQFIDTANYYDWAMPKYYLDASYFNIWASPYLANLATQLTNDADPSNYQKAIYLAARHGGGNGPNASLGETGGDQSVWKLNPKVVVGTGGGDSWYAKYGATGVSYGFNNYAGLCTTMKAIAAAADSKVTDANALRFGQASIIASDYEQYIFGTMGYIQKAINSGTETQKKVVLVEDATYDEDAEAWTFDLLTTTESGGGDGTASQNRYLETVLNTDVTGVALATNLADGQADPSSVGVSVLKSADLIMVGGQQSSTNYATIMEALTDESLLDETYWVQDNGSNGAQYGVVMNSVENAQNVGRILGMLFPDTINQQSWLAYYYQQFYHIDTTYLSQVMDNALEGVRNAAMNDENITLNTRWNFNTAYGNGWSVDKVQKAITDGFTYYQSLQNAAAAE